jgi:hypothetical protein
VSETTARAIPAAIAGVVGLPVSFVSVVLTNL